MKTAIKKLRPRFFVFPLWMRFLRSPSNHHATGGGSGGGSYGSGSGGSVFGRSGFYSTTTYTSIGRTGYRPYDGTPNEEDFICTDAYDTTTNITTTTCTEWNEAEKANWFAIVALAASSFSTYGFSIYLMRNHSKLGAMDDRFASAVAGRDFKKSADLTAQVDEARMEVKKSKVSSTDIQDAPRDGFYSYSYRQNGKTLSGKANLFFANSFGGYDITGSTKDPDGKTNIQEGFCNYSCKAFWSETYVSGNVGMQVLNKGTFDFIAHTFAGEWTASSGESGTVDTFRLDEADVPTASVSTAGAITSYERFGQPANNIGC